jgi:hypothetical protein
MSDPGLEEELPPSKLGTKAYWDEVYEWVDSLDLYGSADASRRETRVFAVSRKLFHLLPPTVMRRRQSLTRCRMLGTRARSGQFLNSQSLWSSCD